MPNLSIEGRRAKIRKLVTMLRRVGSSDVQISKTLVVGVGDGLEARVLAEEMACQVIAIDSAPRFEVGRDGNVDLRAMDARELDFKDAEFDLVYSYHALEHIIDDKKALAEMARVLRPGGIFLVGTPNKTRLISYIKTAPTWRHAIEWNLNDWGQRLRGRFGNEYGAHAGYTSEELVRRCKTAFGSAAPVSHEYYALNYPGHARVLGFLGWSGLWRYAYPGVYVAGLKT
jgi:ubiquinone/menaquinone biosynthesis C-methylase UbiE